MSPQHPVMRAKFRHEGWEVAFYKLKAKSYFRAVA
jgi:hypothetical protein